jgi:hypothetical protein
MKIYLSNTRGFGNVKYEKIISNVYKHRVLKYSDTIERKLFLNMVKNGIFRKKARV